MKRYLAIAALATLAACSTPIINDLAATEQAYTGAEITATAYIKLPACGSAGATAICSNPAKVVQIKNADNAAFTALSTVRAAILANCPSGAITPCSVDMTPAQNAVAAFTALTVGLKIN